MITGGDVALAAAVIAAVGAFAVVLAVVAALAAAAVLGATATRLLLGAVDPLYPRRDPNGGSDPSTEETAHVH